MATSLNVFAFVVVVMHLGSCGASTLLHRATEDNKHQILKREEGKWETANQRADEALTILKPWMLRGEPLVSEDVGTCSRCDTFGLSSVERVGRCSTIELPDDQKRVKVFLGIPSLKATCNCTFGFTSGILKATMDKSVLYLDVLVDFNNDTTEIKEVKVKSTGKLDLAFEGEGVLAWVYGNILAIFKPLFIKNFQSLVLEEVPKIIHENKDGLYALGLVK